MEKEVTKAGKTMSDMELKEMDTYWDAAKKALGHHSSQG
jgi:uncharacterized protein YabN with tetrapyrrole methylase and pyrophosphatase domain